MSEGPSGSKMRDKAFGFSGITGLSSAEATCIIDVIAEAAFAAIRDLTASVNYN